MSKVSEIAMQVDESALNLRKLSALIGEISHYFDEKVEPNSINAMCLISSVDHISLLISLSLDVVSQEISTLTNLANDALASGRSAATEKGGAV